MKVVINRCHGGFSVSKAVYDELGLEWDGHGYLGNLHFDIVNSENVDQYRSDPRLIEAIEKIGLEKASGDLAELKIVEIPDDIEWYVGNETGYEFVVEEHRVWC